MHTEHFVVMVQPSEQRRVGITVTRRIGGAVVRNRVRRLVREAYRLNKAKFPEHCELVVVARNGSDELDYATVAMELSGACRELHRAAARPEPLSRRGAP